MYPDSNERGKRKNATFMLENSLGATFTAVVVVKQTMAGFMSIFMKYGRSRDF